MKGISFLPEIHKLDDRGTKFLQTLKQTLVTFKLNILRKITKK